MQKTLEEHGFVVICRPLSDGMSYLRYDNIIVINSSLSESEISSKLQLIVNALFEDRGYNKESYPKVG